MAFDVTQLDRLAFHINARSWANWEWGTELSLKQIYLNNSDRVQQVFDRCVSLVAGHQQSHLCGFFGQPSVVRPIGDILTEYYRQKANRSMDFPVLFAKRGEVETVAQFIQRNPKVDDMIDVSQRDKLMAFTFSFFRDMRLMDSAMDVFLRNTCGRNASFHPDNHLTQRRVEAIIFEEVLEIEFGLKPTDQDYQQAKPALLDTIRKIISLADRSIEGVVNFLAIPRAYAENRENSLFYPSISKGVPITLPEEAAERKRFFDALQTAPHELKVPEEGCPDKVVPQGRLLRRALTCENQQIKVVRLAMLRPELEQEYQKLIRELVQSIIKLQR